jgi:hypothetical protein
MSFILCANVGLLTTYTKQQHRLHLYTHTSRDQAQVYLWTMYSTIDLCRTDVQLHQTAISKIRIGAFARL